MKKYLAPEIELLYLANEDVLTVSAEDPEKDPYESDPYDETQA